MGFPVTPVYLTLDDVLAIHAEVMGAHASIARDYLRDESLLESALNRPKQAAYYEEADLVQQAATLLWGLVRNPRSMMAISAPAMS